MRAHRRVAAWQTAVLMAMVMVACSGGGGGADASLTPSTGVTPTEGSSTTAPDDLSWLKAFGPATSDPAVPDGWQLVDYRDVRLAVPGDWVVSSEPIGDRSVSGVVRLPGAAAVADDVAAADVPSVGIVAWGNSVPAGAAVTIGQRAAVRVAGSTAEASDQYFLDDGLVFTVTGPDCEAILATFTWSGVYRALQDGVVADTSGWARVGLAGVGLRVPAEWAVVNLPASMHEVVDESGAVIGSGGRADPGVCGMYFSAEPLVFLGESGLTPLCGPPPEDRPPYDGLWVRYAGAVLTGSAVDPLASGTIGGMAVEAYDGDSEVVGAAHPGLDLVVRAPAATVFVSVGVRADASEVRAVLRSIERLPMPTGATAATGNTLCDESPASWVPPRELQDSVVGLVIEPLPEGPIASFGVDDGPPANSHVETAFAAAVDRIGLPFPQPTGGCCEEPFAVLVSFQSGTRAVLGPCDIALSLRTVLEELYAAAV